MDHSSNKRHLFSREDDLQVFKEKKEYMGASLQKLSIQAREKGLHALHEQYEYMKNNPERLSVQLVKDYMKRAQKNESVHDNIFNNMHVFFPVNKGSQEIKEGNRSYMREKLRIKQEMRDQLKPLLDEGFSDEYIEEYAADLISKFSEKDRSVSDTVQNRKAFTDMKDLVKEVYEKIGKNIPLLEEKSKENHVEVAARETFYEVVELLRKRIGENSMKKMKIKIPTPGNFSMRDDKGLIPFYVAFYKAMRRKGFTHEQITR